MIMKKNPTERSSMLVKMKSAKDETVPMLHPSAILCVLCVSAMIFFLAPAANGQDEPPWTASFGTDYISRHVAYGVDLSESPAIGFSAGLGHASGFTLDAGALRTLGSGGELQNWSAGLGYELSLAEILSLEAGFTHYEYSNDSANALASLSNSLSFGLGADFGAVSVGLSYDTFLGGAGASFISADVSSFHDFGSFYLVPLAQLTFVSQKVESLFLKSGKKGMGTSTSTITTVTGLSSFSLHAVIFAPIAEGLSFTVHPYYLYSPSELSSSSSRFIWSAGLRYSVEW